MAEGAWDSKRNGGCGAARIGGGSGRLVESRQDADRPPIRAPTTAGSLRRPDWRPRRRSIRRQFSSAPAASAYSGRPARPLALVSARPGGQDGGG